MKVGILKPWEGEMLTRKHWSKSRKQLIRSRSKVKSFWSPTSLSASYRKAKSGIGRGCRRRRRSPSHASHFASKPAEKAGKGPMAGGQGNAMQYPLAYLRGGIAEREGDLQDRHLCRFHRPSDCLRDRTAQ